MDITTWSPHGLITTPLSEILYLSAQISMDPFGNIIDPKEQQTVELFCALFNKFIFREDEFISFSQAQPQLQSNEACGFVIENYVADKDAYHILCFLEVRRAKNQTGSHIVALETQALGNCGQFFQANPGVPFIYACTLVGTYIRCWTILATEDGGPRMQGFWGGYDKGTFDHYLDVGLEQNKGQLERAFQHMKTTPPTKRPLNVDPNNVASG